MNNTPLFSRLPFHRVRQLEVGSPSDRVYPALLPHERLNAAWGSEIRTACGMPEYRSPMQFLGRIAALIPPPRSHLVRYHGVFAPHSKHRERIVPNPPPLPLTTPAAPSATEDTTSAQTPPPSRSRPDWASLLRRVFALDVLHCARCGGRRQLLTMISEAKTAQKILNHLGLRSQAPSQSPARAPPLFPEAGDWSDQAGVDPIPSSWSS